MKHERIFFGETLDCGYMGRNGFGKISGLDVTLSCNHTEELVYLQPIQSRGAIANCMIRFPKAVLPKIIHALQQMEGGK